MELFPPHIQQEIKATTTALDQMQKEWRDTVSLHGHFVDPRITIYDCYPQLFLKAFPTLTATDIRPLGIAGRLFACSIILYDKVMDRDAPASRATSEALSIQAMQWEAYRLLHYLFQPGAKFWQRFHTYLLDHAEACIEEQRFASGERGWEKYTEEIALRIARGKNGIARASVAGLTEISGDEHLLDPLVESINHFNIACQMWDDLCDWKKDFQAGVPSLLLARVLPQRPTFSHEEALHRAELLARKIYYEGHARYVLKLALNSLDRAGHLAGSSSKLEWHDVIDKMRRRCEDCLCDISRIIMSNIERVRQQPVFSLMLPPAENEWQAVAWDALRFLVKQWQRGFGEARHLMRLSYEEGFESRSEYHYGDAFQRALVADVLCDANKLIAGLLRPVIDYEVRYLLEIRQQDGVGGWCYFQDVPEIAPDADDLGQVMQVLLRAGYRLEVTKFCEAILTVLLRDNTRSDGSIETWIVPASGRTPQQERQAEFNQTKWGIGPDNEVMANLLYALALYDQKRFAATIEKGVSYLESQQQLDGSWASRWYYGLYYGTYVCLRLLAAAKPDSPAIERAASFLRNSQRADGGWRMEAGSDPLNTALALLGLAIVQPIIFDSADAERVVRALSYLQENQGLDKAWQSVPFIRPRLSEPYGSRTITSLYILKAMVAWQEITSYKETEISVGASLAAV